MTIFLHLSRVAGEEVSYQYDAAGRLISADYGSGRIDYLYDPASNILTQNTSVITDADADRMDDLWETIHFGNLARSGQQDFDEDGQIDLNEYLAGTSPTDPGSNLRLTQPLVVGNAVLVEWTSVPGKRYQLQFKLSLTESVWINLGGVLTATGSKSSQSEEIPANVPSRYYRVVLLP